MEACCHYIDKGPVDKIPLKLELEAMQLAVRKQRVVGLRSLIHSNVVVDPPNGDDFVKEMNFGNPGSIS